MITLFQEVNMFKLTSVITTGLIICLMLLIVALFRNLKLKSENNKLRSRMNKD